MVLCALFQEYILKVAFIERKDLAQGVDLLLITLFWFNCQRGYLISVLLIQILLIIKTPPFIIIWLPESWLFQIDVGGRDVCIHLIVLDANFVLYDIRMPSPSGFGDLNRFS